MKDIGITIHPIDISGFADACKKVSESIEATARAMGERLMPVMLAILPRSGFEGMLLAYRPQDANWSTAWTRGFWFEFWTPYWHEGRGPYLSIGCGFFAIYRGY